jgi:hypothetical protein
MASPHTYGFSVANATIHRTGVLHRLAGVGGPAFAAGHLPRRLPSAPPDAARRAALVVLWFLVSFALACLRIAAGVCRSCTTRLGPVGVLFTCSHRMLLDPIFLSAALGRLVAAVTYSLSRLSEFLSPIRTVPNGLPKNTHVINPD